MSYLIVMPARNEATYIEACLNCIVAQSLLPTLLIVVDDGSTDATPSIVERFAGDYDWIRLLRKKDRGVRSVGPGVIETFYMGLNSINIDDFEFVCKLDADMTFGINYFQRAIDLLRSEERLASISGKVFNPRLLPGRLVEERIIDEHVAGQAKLYKVEAFKDIGGFVREVMWDGIDCHMARAKGWVVRSVRDSDLNLYHHRLMGSSYKSVLHGRLRWGRGQYFMGSHPLYVLASGVNRLFERPFVIGGVLIIVGYFFALLKRSTVFGDVDFRRHLRSWQIRRLYSFLRTKGRVGAG